MAGVISEESRIGIQIFPVGKFGDSDADDREVLGLPFLNQAADVHLGDLGKERIYQETIDLSCRETGFWHQHQLLPTSSKAKILQCNKKRDLCFGLPEYQN